MPLFSNASALPRLFQLSLLILLFHSSAFAKNEDKVSVQGYVLDGASRMAIEFATVALYDAKEERLIDGTITNAGGAFRLTAGEAGEYVIKATFVGYESNTLRANISAGNHQLPESVYLYPATVELDAVSVTERKLEKQTDIEKTQINLDRNMASVSGNLTDVLKHHSAISIDADQNIYLRGSDQVVVMIDGQSSTLSNLQSIPASSVESIEIITNPDAGYDAEGSAGIINVVLKQKAQNGSSGSIMLNYGMQNRANGGFSFFRAIKDWNLGLSYSSRYEEITIDSRLDRELFQQQLVTRQQVAASQILPHHMAHFTASTITTAKARFSLGVKIVLPGNRNRQQISGEVLFPDEPDMQFKRYNSVSWDRTMAEFQTSYERPMKHAGDSWKASAFFSRINGDRPASYLLDGQHLERSEAGGAPTSANVGFDYINSSGFKGSLEAGIKATSRWNSFTATFFDRAKESDPWQVNPMLTNDLTHQENIFAAYLTYADTLAGKLFFRAGSRLEYSSSYFEQKTSNEQFRETYLIPFPSLLLKYPISPGQSIALGLTRRVSRPKYPQLNPFIAVIDQITYETGNKDLRPELADKAELNYQLIKQQFQLQANIFYALGQHYLTQVSLSDNSKLIMTWVNGDKRYQAGLESDIRIKAGSKLTFNPAVAVYHTRTTGIQHDIDLSTNSLSYTLNLKASLNGPFDTEWQCNFQYSSPTDLPQFRLNEIYFFDIGVQRRFLNKRLTATVNISDLFNTREWHISSSNHIYQLNNYSKNDTRIFWFGLSYNLQAGKPASKPQQDEKEEGGMIRLGQ